MEHFFLDRQVNSFLCDADKANKTRGSVYTEEVRRSDEGECRSQGEDS